MFYHTLVSPSLHIQQSMLKAGASPPPALADSETGNSLSVPKCELSSAKMLIWPNREVLYQQSQFAELHHGRAKDGSILPF
jgi:hypothetical protein